MAQGWALYAVAAQHHQLRGQRVRVVDADMVAGGEDGGELLLGDVSRVVPDGPVYPEVAVAFDEEAAPEAPAQLPAAQPAEDLLRRSVLATRTAGGPHQLLLAVPGHLVGLCVEWRTYGGRGQLWFRGTGTGTGKSAEATKTNRGPKPDFIANLTQTVATAF